MAEYLPFNLITEILKKLPVKSLHRLKCVSKTWNSTISSSKFIKQHLRQTLISNINTNTHIIISTNSIVSSALSTVEFRFDIVNHPLKNIPHCLPVYISGSVHGVLLLVDSLFKTVCLFNPSNKTQRLVPPAPSHKPACDDFDITEVFGFGYDSVTDDYKVVKLVQWENCEKTCLYSETCVYSMRNDSWELVYDDSLIYPLQQTNAIVVEGLLWFVVISWENERLFKCFDLRTNTFSFVNFPELDRDSDNHFYSLRSLCGCLSLVVSYRKKNCELLYADVWALNNSKWVKLYSIQRNEIRKHCKYLRLVTYSKDMKSVLIEVDSSWYGWYDLVTKKFKRVRVQGLGAVDSPYLSYSYVETLVSVVNNKVVSNKEGTNRLKKTINMNDFLSSGFKIKL